MSLPSTSRPISGGLSLLAALLAILCPLITIGIPTGDGEQGFARYVAYRVLASALVGLLVFAWAIAAIVSLHRRERVGQLLLLGLTLNVAAIGLCIPWWLN
jgi:hypothetical protein